MQNNERRAADPRAVEGRTRRAGHRAWHPLFFTVRWLRRLSAFFVTTDATRFAREVDELW